MAIPGIGEQFRHFRILANAGQGGMGVVLRAVDTRLGRDVALKFLTGIGSLDAATAERTRVEARSLAALNHANIVTIYDIDELNGSPFLVMEWVSGTSLDRARRTDPYDEDEFLRIALAVSEALAAAHSRGIIHRDVKPANVLLADDGAVKLVDFGLARLGGTQHQLTKTAAVLGTPAYMSPEQASADEASPASDVFSFGVMAYEMLAGQAPFRAPSVPALLHAIVHTPHAPLAALRPNLSPTVTTLIERCLQKRPENRYPNAAELAQDVHRAIRARVAGIDTASRTSIGHAARRSGSPPIKYCHTDDGASVAYAVHGSGPVLVRVLGWFTHIEMEWEWPALRLIWERLGETYTVVRYDGRGVGLSSPWTEEFSEQTRQLDLDAVLKAIGAEQVVLFGISEGGFTAAHYASHHPERVSHLVVYGSYSRGVKFRPGYDPEEDNALEVLIRKGWGRDTPQVRQLFTTAYFGADADPGLIAHFNKLQRAAADGDTAARYQRSLHRREDAREVFARIRRPTLVIHCRDDQIVAFEEGRLIASIVPGARFVPFPTATHYFPIDDDVTDRMAREIATFTRATG